MIKKVKRVTKSNGKVKLAVVQNDVKHILDNQRIMDGKIDKIVSCVQRNDNRIQKLEDKQEFLDNEYKKGQTRNGILVGVITFIVSTIVNFYIWVKGG